MSNFITFASRIHMIGFFMAIILEQGAMTSLRAVHQFGDRLISVQPEIGECDWILSQLEKSGWELMRNGVA